MRKPAHFTHENNKRKKGFAFTLIFGSVQQLLVRHKRVEKSLFLPFHTQTITQLQKQSWNETQFPFCFTIYGSAQVGGRRGKTEWAKESERRGEGKQEQISPTSGHVPIF